MTLPTHNLRSFFLQAIWSNFCTCLSHCNIVGLNYKLFCRCIFHWFHCPVDLQDICSTEIVSFWIIRPNYEITHSVRINLPNSGLFTLVKIIMRWSYSFEICLCNSLVFLLPRLVNWQHQQINEKYFQCKNF